MYIKLSQNRKKEWIRHITLGAGAGFLNGLLGAGGGILLVHLFTPKDVHSTPESTRNAFFCTLAAILPMTALSAILYALDGQTARSLTEMTPLVIPAIAGGTAGAFLLERIHATLLKAIFSLLVLYAGISMVMR